MLRGFLCKPNSPPPPCCGCGAMSPPPPPDIFDQYAALCNLKGIHIYTLPVMLSYKGRVLIIILAFITNMSLLWVMQIRVKKVEKVPKRAHAICFRYYSMLKFFFLPQKFLLEAPFLQSEIVDTVFTIVFLHFLNFYYRKHVFRKLCKRNLLWKTLLRIIIRKDPTAGNLYKNT